MISAIDHLKCTGCGACQNKCPAKCISMESDNEGFLYPEIDKNNCVHCGLCDSVCPLQKNQEAKKQAQNVFAAQNIDILQREQSSSGGIFTLLAERTLKNGGVVFGAAFDEGCYSVSHLAINSNEGLKELRLSKYLQSDKKSTYSEAETLLIEGKQVLFSGTPCEIAGLKQYLGKEYENLLCVDVVCHGAPSQKIWENHLKIFESKYDGKVNKVNFRDKTHHIHHHRIIQTKEGKDVLFSKGSDPYMLLFLSNYSLRPSCYQCSYKGNNYFSDITLGDFWGIGTVCPEMQDGKGTSMIITRTYHGLSVLYEIMHLLNLKEVEFSNAVRNNPTLIESVKEPADRDVFFQSFQNGNTDIIEEFVLPRKKGIIERIAGTKAGLFFLGIKHRRKISPSETDYCVRYTIYKQT